MPSATATLVFPQYALAGPGHDHGESAFAGGVGPATHFDLTALANISDGFSGAEIEQVIVSALYSVAASDAELSMSALEEAIHGTNPLSVVMEEKIRQLRAWATERCVFADD